MNDQSISPPPTNRLTGRIAGVLLLALVSLTVLPFTASAAYATPTGLKATSVTANSVTLAWNDVANAPKYRIQYSTSSSMSSAVYHRFVDNQAVVPNLKPGVTYYFKVRVITTDGANLSSYSPAITAKTSAAPAGPGATSASPLRVASYNIRCANCFGGEPNELRWADRRGTVVEAIKGENLDVLGVQEASQGWLKDSSGKSIDLSQFEDLRNRMGSNWALTNAKRNNCVKDTTPTNCVYKDQGASQGTRILYNKDRVEMVSSGSKLLPSMDKTTNARYLAWAILRQRSTGLKFFFGSSHLEPGSTKYQMRKDQAEAAVATIKAKNVDRLPVISVGDWNSSRFADPTNAPYDVYVKAGLRDPLGGSANVTTSAPGAYAEKRVQTWLNSFNGFVRQAKGNQNWINGSYIDYMMTTPMRVAEWETVSKLDSNENYVGIIPADHNMIRMTVHLPV